MRVGRYHFIARLSELLSVDEWNEYCERGCTDGKACDEKFVQKMKMAKSRMDEASLED